MLGKDVANSIEVVPVNEERLFSALTRFDLSKFNNLTVYYFLNCLSKIHLKTERNEIKLKVIDFLRRVQSGKVKMTNIARVKAVEIRLMLELDEEKRKEVFDEVPQSSLPEIFAQ